MSLTSLPNEVVWAASIELHTQLHHPEPWEICTSCNDDIAGPIALAAVNEYIRTITI